MTRLRVGWSRVRIPVGARYFSPKRLDRIRRPHILLFKQYRCSFSRVKRSGDKVDHLPPSNAEIRVRGAVTQLPLYAIMVWIGTALSFCAETRVSSCFGIVDKNVTNYELAVVRFTESVLG